MSSHSRTIPPDTYEEIVSPKQTERECAGLSQSQRWRMEQRGEFPKRIQITPGRVGYLRSELEAWKRERIAAGLAARAAKAEQHAHA
jgi:predicted DNA-binding transcriptional regulator AlpA